LYKDDVFHDESKHIEIWYHFIRDMVQRGAIKLHYVGTDEQVVDVLTKSLSRVNFKHFRDKLGVVRKELPRKGECCCDAKLVLKISSFVLMLL
jgi:hypothetical protein